MWGDDMPFVIKPLGYLLINFGFCVDWVWEGNIYINNSHILYECHVCKVVVVKQKYNEEYTQFAS